MKSMSEDAKKLRLNKSRDEDGGDSASTNDQVAKYAQGKRIKQLRTNEKDQNEQIENASQSARSVKTGTETMEVRGMHNLAKMVRDGGSKYVCVPAEQTSTLRSTCGLDRSPK